MRIHMAKWKPGPGPNQRNPFGPFSKEGSIFVFLGLVKYHPAFFRSLTNSYICS